jgi:ABC-type hemin transport system ATPase subunit
MAPGDTALTRMRRAELLGHIARQHFQPALKGGVRRHAGVATLAARLHLGQQRHLARLFDEPPSLGYQHQELALQVTYIFIKQLK